jgi:hypothetical protein
VKRSGRDESVWVVTHLYMEAMLEISIAILISTNKNALFSSLLLMSSLQQNWRKGQNRFCLEARGGLGGEGKDGGGGQGEKWPKQCMHM